MSTKSEHFSTRKPLTKSAGISKKDGRIFKPVAKQTFKEVKFLPRHGFTINEKAIALAYALPVITTAAFVLMWPLFKVSQWQGLYIALFVSIGLITLCIAIANSMEICATPAWRAGKKDPRMVALYDALNRSSYSNDTKHQLATLLAGKARKLHGSPENNTHLYIAIRTILTEYFIEAKARQTVKYSIEATAKEAIRRIHTAYDRSCDHELIDRQLNAKIKEIKQEAQRKQNEIIAQTYIEIDRLQTEANIKKMNP